jgi:hypothetical protein
LVPLPPILEPHLDLPQRATQLHCQLLTHRQRREFVLLEDAFHALPRLVDALCRRRLFANTTIATCALHIALSGTIRIGLCDALRRAAHSELANDSNLTACCNLMH